jgi:hypothetical protein
MTRAVVFEGPKAATRFTLIWTALATGGDGKGDRSPATIRKEARLQDAFDRISEPTASPTGNEPDRKLTGETQTVVLAQEDFDLLQQYTEKVAWSPRVSRDVVDLWDFLSACPKQE